jgi:hypothetical protein
LASSGKLKRERLEETLCPHRQLIAPGALRQARAPRCDKSRRETQRACQARPCKALIESARRRAPLVEAALWAAEQLRATARAARIAAWIRAVGMGWADMQANFITSHAHSMK